MFIISSTSVAALLAFFSVAAAKPLAPAEPLTPAQLNAQSLTEGWTVYSNQTLDNGSILTLWNPPALEARDRSGLSKRCGSNRIECNDSHQPKSGPCSSLREQIYLNRGNTLPATPRALCLSQGSDQCCVSWANLLHANTPWATLISANDALQFDCVNNGKSGRALDVNLSDVCTTQCMSNRAEGCKN